MLLDQNAAGPGVAEVQHQVHLHRWRPGVSLAQQLDPRQDARGTEQAQQDSVTGDRLEPAGQILGPQRTARAGGGQHLDPHLAQPLAEPGRGHEPFVLRRVGDKDELRLLHAIGRAGRDIGAVRGLGQEGGVEGERERMRAARRGVRHDPRPHPVTWADRMRLLPGAGAGQQSEER